jgi:hypothetical protein
VVGEFTSWPLQPEQAARWQEHYRPYHMRQLGGVMRSVMQVKRGEAIIAASECLPEGQHDSMQPPVKDELDRASRLSLQLAIIDGVHNHQPPKPMV